MALIDLNLDDTPDRMLPISPGVRTLDIRDIKEEEDKNGDNVVIVECAVNEPDSDEHERRTWERFNFKYPAARVKFKQLVKSAGHSGTGEGVETSDLIGCTIQAIVKSRTYKDKDTGETVETAQVSKFLFEDESD